MDQRHDPLMEDAQVGSVFRVIRIRLGLSQAEVATAAGVSRSTVSVIERGHLRNASIGTVRDVAAVLGISVPFTPRWRGPELTRLLDHAHSELVGKVVAAVQARGWEARPELTFNRWGERGSIDVFAWRADPQAVMTIECKSVLVDLQDLLSTMDRKRRLAPDIAHDALGWTPRAVGSVLVLPETTCSRLRVAQHRVVLDTTLPGKTIDVRRWMREPRGPLEAIWFLRYSSGSGRRGGHGGPLRIEPARRAR